MVEGVERAVAGPLRALVIDDDPDHLAITIANLQRGFDTHGRKAGMHALSIDTANGLEQAQRRLKEHDYDVLLVDLSLPDSPSPTETLERIRLIAPQTPVLAITGHETVDDAVASAVAGADAFFPKSELSPERLIRAVLTTILRARLR